MKQSIKITYPYGFHSWLNKVWQICKEKGIVNKNTNPCDTGLDEQNWLSYFMDGFSPMNAVITDINEGGE